MSNRSEVLSVVVERLAAIKIADGYATDAGQTLAIGEVPLLGKDDPDSALALKIGDDDPRWQGEQVLIRLPITIWALAKVDDVGAWLTLEHLLSDIKRAMELADRSLGKRLKGQLERGPTRSMPREPGSTTVGAGITYWLPYVEVWGTP